MHKLIYDFSDGEGSLALPFAICPIMEADGGELED